MNLSKKNTAGEEASSFSHPQDTEGNTNRNAATSIRECRMSQDIATNTSNSTEVKKEGSFFVTRSFNDWSKIGEQMPDQRMLCGELIVEGEVTMIFAQENVGKTSLGYTIAEGIARGAQNIIGDLGSEMGAVNTLFVDCEMSTKQYRRRVISKDGSRAHRFPDNLKRTELDFSHFPKGQTKTNALLKGIENEIMYGGYKVIFIDNLTWISPETEKAKEASELLQEIRAMAARLNVTFIFFGHTPKIPPCTPITANHLAGSARLKDFFDAIIGMGKSYDESEIYLKQLKCRYAEKHYTAKNVLVGHLENSNDWVHFEFDRFAKEDSLLTEGKNRERDDKIISLYKQGKTQQQIQQIMGISQSTVSRVIKEHKEQFSENKKKV